MTSQRQIFSINGVIDTDKTVWNNIELIAAACASWPTYDNVSGQYGVVINRPESVSKVFTDDNIIGGITLTETNYEDIYNSCEISFPNRDIKSRVDFIRYDEGVAARYDFEPDNKLTLSSDLINDPVQADVVAITELKQSRQNKVITFATDFSSLGTQPGDVIQLTNSYWGWENKLFRVTTVEEDDRDDGSIVLNITAVEYNDQVYNYDGITRFDRTETIGIPYISVNQDIQTKNDESLGQDVGDALQTDTGKTAITGAGVPIFDSASLGYDAASVDGALNAGQTVAATVNLAIDGKYLLAQVDIPQGQVNYDVYINEVLESRVYAGTVPVECRLQYSPDNTVYTDVYTKYIGWADSGSVVFTVDNPVAGFYKVIYSKFNTNDLDQNAPSSVTAPEVVSINTVATAANQNGDATEFKYMIMANG